MDTPAYPRPLGGSLHRLVKVRRVRGQELLHILSVLTLFFNTALPKGGFYLGGVPVTWGYLLLGISGSLVTISVLRGRHKLGRYEALAVILILGFTLLCLIYVATAGVSTGAGLAFTFSYFVSISLIPAFAILTTSYLLKEAGLTSALRTIRIALAVIAVWGLVHFVMMNAFGQFCGIPFLTLTGADLESIRLNHINRGDVFKMVSTYNNGNILGVNVLLWFPLAVYGLSSARWRYALLGRALFLFSLSRTVWLGWIFSEVAARLYLKRRLRDLALLAAIIPLLIGAIYAVLNVWFTNPIGFIFDANLGGRLDQLTAPVSVWGQPFIGIAEIVYAAILRNFGALGLVAFVLTWSFPLILRASCWTAKAAKLGLVTYLLVMASDGAFVLVPTQYTYWMVATFLLAASPQAGQQLTGYGDSPDRPTQKRFTT